MRLWRPTFTPRRRRISRPTSRSVRPRLPSVTRHLRPPGKGTRARAREPSPGTPRRAPRAIQRTGEKRTRVCRFVHSGTAECGRSTCPRPGLSVRAPGVRSPRHPSAEEESPAMPIEPGKIRNVAVVGHRGTGKTSLLEAMLVQSAAANRLGAIEQGTTVSDWDDDEQKRQMSLAASLCHVDWQGRKINLLAPPGDAGFLGDAIAALRAVQGALFALSGVMGV